MKFSELWRELKDRRVVRVLIGYAVVAAVIVQAADLTLEPLGLPAWAYNLRARGHDRWLPCGGRPRVGVRCDARRDRTGERPAGRDAAAHSVGGWLEGRSLSPWGSAAGDS